jgi:RHS repeat-associated protein
LITQKVIKNSSDVNIQKIVYTRDSRNQLTEEAVYNDGATLSYTTYFAYDDWGNCIYAKNAEGHEQFSSYANTSTSGFFVDNTGTVIKTFTNAFSNSTVPSTLHTALLGTAERQDATYVREIYLTFDSEGHTTQSQRLFGNATTWLTFSGTFNEKTGNTSFPIDLSGHTVAGNAVLQISGMESDDTYNEYHTSTCPLNPTACQYCKVSFSYWAGYYCKVNWYLSNPYTSGTSSNGPFTHRPGTPGYQSYTAYPFLVYTYWKAYPVQVKYNLDGSAWETITPNLKNTTVTKTVPVTDGSHTLYFSESSSQKTKFSWNLWVPVDTTPDTYSTFMQYDDYGNVTSMTDAESNTVSFTYSSGYSHAYLTEISAMVSGNTLTTKATYDPARGWITSIQGPKGVDAGSGYDYLYTYDVLGRVTKKEFPLLSGQQNRSYLEAIYDDSNRTVTLIDPLRHYVMQYYDKLGRETSLKWYSGTYGSGTLYATSSMTYRYDGLKASVTDPGNDTTSYTYDFLGRPTQITYPDSSSISYTYDDTNNKVTFINGRSYERIYLYDWLFRLEKVEEEYAPDTFTATTYTYDDIGHLLSFTDPENHTTSYTYASLFGLTTTTYSDSEYETYIYDDVGNIISFTDCNGNTASYTYDDIYRLIEIEYEDQSTVSYTYDLNSNRTRMDDDAPSTGDYVDYTYDQWNRLLTETRNISQDSYPVTYQYDVTSRVTQLTYPDSMQILYDYDDLNRITEIKRYIDGQNDEILFDNTQYDVENLLTQFDYGNDIQATYTYDSRDRPLTIDVKDGVTSLLDLDYTYDNNSNITQLINGWRDTNSTWHSETESYSYDGLDRLTSASCTFWSHTYTYDKVGNRAGKDSITYTINSVNEVTALSDGTSFTYNDNGNRTQKTNGDDTWDYTYDYANRLIKVEENDSTIGEYVYDGDGKRLQKIENSITTTYIYSGINTIFEENSTGSAGYIYGPTGLTSKRTTINQEFNIYYYHKDHLGSIRSVTDFSKNIIVASTYHPFGETDVKEGSEHYLFNGKETDSTGLYYYGARYYDSQVGRFITRDPLIGIFVNPQTLNRYTFCVNNPIKYIDLAGLSYSFVDEEIEEEMNGTGESNEEYGSDPLVFQLPGEEYIVFDLWGRSGNVIVGYGYIMGYTGNTAYLKTGPVFCVIEFNDDGSVKNHEYWKAKDVDKWNKDDYAFKLDEVISDEHLQDLSDALRGLMYAINERLEVPLWKAIIQPMIIGGGAGFVCTGNGPQSIPPAIIGALVGAVAGIADAGITWYENRRWRKRSEFISNLFLGKDKTQLPPPS